MTIQSQRDKRWSGQKLGTCSVTIGSQGCACTSVSILCDKTPDVVNNILKANGGYINGCLMNWSKAASLFGLEYATATNRAIKYPTIAEVDFNPNTTTKEQHFVVVLDENTMIDPWVGEQMGYVYKIISYRNLSPKITGDNMAKVEFYKLSSGSNTIYGIWKGQRYAYTNWPDYLDDGGLSNQSNVKIVNSLPLTELDRVYIKLEETIKEFEVKFNRQEGIILESQRQLQVQKNIYEGQIAELKKGELVKVNWVDTFKAMIRDFIKWVDEIKQKIKGKE
jgi:hypothetical protein